MYFSPGSLSYLPAAMDQTLRAEVAREGRAGDRETHLHLRMTEKEVPSSPAPSCKTREDPPFYTQTELLLKVDNKQKLLDFRAR